MQSTPQAILSDFMEGMLSADASYTMSRTYPSTSSFKNHSTDYSKPQDSFTQLNNMKIPSRIYTVPQIILESLLGSFHVPPSKANAVLSWYETHYTTLPFSYVALSVVFLSVVIISLHSPTQIGVDITILGILLILWALIAVYTRYYGTTSHSKYLKTQHVFYNKEAEFLSEIKTGVLHSATSFKVSPLIPVEPSRPDTYTHTINVSYKQISTEHNKTNHLKHKTEDRLNIYRPLSIRYNHIMHQFNTRLYPTQQLHLITNDVDDLPDSFSHSVNTITYIYSDDIKKEKQQDYVVQKKYSTHSVQTTQCVLLNPLTHQDNENHSNSLQHHLKANNLTSLFIINDRLKNNHLIYFLVSFTFAQSLNCFLSTLNCINTLSWNEPFYVEKERHYHFIASFFKETLSVLFKHYDTQNNDTSVSHQSTVNLLSQGQNDIMLCSRRPIMNMESCHDYTTDVLSICSSLPNEILQNGCLDNILNEYFKIQDTLLHIPPWDTSSLQQQHSFSFFSLPTFSNDANRYDPTASSCHILQSSNRPIGSLTHFTDKLMDLNQLIPNTTDIIHVDTVLLQDIILEALDSYLKQTEHHQDILCPERTHDLHLVVEFTIIKLMNQLIQFFGFPIGHCVPFNTPLVIHPYQLLHYYQHNNVLWEFIKQLYHLLHHTTIPLDSKHHIWPFMSYYKQHTLHPMTRILSVSLLLSMCYCTRDILLIGCYNCQESILTYLNKDKKKLDVPHTPTSSIHLLFNQTVSDTDTMSLKQSDVSSQIIHDDIIRLITSPQDRQLTLHTIVYHYIQHGIETIYYLRYLFSFVLPTISDYVLFDSVIVNDILQTIEILIQCYLLIGSTEAMTLWHILSVWNTTMMSSSFLCRSLTFCQLSPIASEFSQLVHQLFNYQLTHSFTDIAFPEDVWFMLLLSRIQHDYLMNSNQAGGFTLHTPFLLFQNLHDVYRIWDNSIHPDQRQYLSILESIVTTDFQHPHQLLHPLYVLLHSTIHDTDVFNITTLNTILNDWIRDHCHHFMIEKLFHLITKLSIINSITVHTMIHYYCNLQPPLLHSAIQCLDIMTSDELKITGHSFFTCIISAAIVNEQLELIWPLIDKMNHLTITIERFLCQLIIKQLRPTSSNYTKKKMLQFIDSINVSDDQILFSAIIDVCSQLKDLGRLESVIQQFKQGRQTHILSVHTYGTLIKAYGRCQAVNQAWDLWNTMISYHHLEPTSYTYGCMLDMLVSNGSVEDAIHLLLTAIQSGKKANTVQYSILIKGCAQKKLLQPALDLFYDMRRRGVECNGVTYNTLLHACVSSKDMKRAEIVAQMMKNSGTCQPDVITYSTLIKGYCDIGDINNAFESFNIMTQHHIVPDAVVYNTLLEGCAKHMQLEKAEALFSTMLQNNISPSSFTLTILIKMFGKGKKLYQALQIANELPKRFSFEPDAYVYTALIAACLTNYEIDGALYYFYVMNHGDMRSSVTSRTFGTMIIGCIKGGRLITAYQFVCDAFSRQIILERRIVSRLASVLYDDYVGYVENKRFHSAILPLTLIPMLPNICSWLTEYSQTLQKQTSPPPVLPSNCITPNDYTAVDWEKKYVVKESKLSNDLIGKQLSNRVSDKNNHVTRQSQKTLRHEIHGCHQLTQFISDRKKHFQKIESCPKHISVLNKTHKDKNNCIYLASNSPNSVCKKSSTHQLTALNTLFPKNSIHITKAQSTHFPSSIKPQIFQKKYQPIENLIGASSIHSKYHEINTSSVSLVNGSCKKSLHSQNNVIMSSAPHDDCKQSTVAFKKTLPSIPPPPPPPPQRTPLPYFY